MRLVELPRTTSFRLALRFLPLFGTASLALFGFLFWQTQQYMQNRVDDWLRREQTVFSPLDRHHLLERLTAHLVADPSLERSLALYDEAGHRVVGSPLDLPPGALAGMPQDTPFAFKLGQDSHARTFRVVAHRRPSGDTLLVARDMGEPRAFAWVLIKVFVLGGFVTAVLCLAGAAVIGADAVRRIDEVTHAIQRIVSGDLSERLPSRGRTDDLGRLVDVINGMLGELEYLMQEVKGVCDNIAHDLRTPLTRLLAGLERTRRRAAAPDEYAAAIDEAIVGIKDVLATFAALLRISEIESGARRAGFCDVDLGEVIADAVALYEPVAEAKGVHLLAALEDGPVMMRGDPSLLFEAVSNLVDNALKFTPRGGRVTARGFVRLGVAGLDVMDNGPGISSAESTAVLRRFYRTEASRHTPGSGLGLALVAAVARLHGMDMDISDARPGCRITLTGERLVIGSVPQAGVDDSVPGAQGGDVRRATKQPVLPCGLSQPQPGSSSGSADASAA